VSTLKDLNGNSFNHLNIGTGKDISIKQLAEKEAKFWEFKGKIAWDK
tara:strand:+ start:400 stop:540 length:141 start_codon:yes stop_codon:yes gene_type:complete